MSGKLQATIVNRRTVLISAANAGLVLTAISIPSASIAASDGQASARFETAYAQIIGAATPADGLITLTLPANFDNGHAVPFTIAVDSPMTPASHITTIHMLSTANPVAEIATFDLTPATGAAIISGRFRLAKSQDVYVLAQRNDGALFVAKQLVKVKISGCS